MEALGRRETVAVGAGGPAPARTVAAVCAATLAYFTGLGLLIPEIPQFLTSTLHLGDGAVGASVATFSGASVAGRLPMMWLGNRFSPRSLLAVGALTGGAGEVVFASAGSLPALLLMRVLGGLGDALFYTAATTCVIDAGPAGPGWPGRVHTDLGHLRGPGGRAGRRRGDPDRGRVPASLVGGGRAVSHRGDRQLARIRGRGDPGPGATG